MRFIVAYAVTAIVFLGLDALWLSQLALGMYRRELGGLLLEQPNLLIAGLNPVCTDAVATAAMGYDPRATKGSVPFRNCDNTMLLAEAHGVGAADLTRIDVRGLSVKDALHPFEPAPAAGRAGSGSG